MAMENLIKINHLRQNDIEFDLEVEGDAVDGEEFVVRFVIETSNVHLMFPCVVENKKCIVKIPILDFIDKTTFNYRIEVVVDGYYFEANRGIITVVGTSELYTTQPKVKLTSKTNTQTDEPISKGKTRKRAERKETETNVKEESKRTSFLRDVNAEITGTSQTSVEKLAETILKEGGSTDVIVEPEISDKDTKVKEILQNIAALRANTGSVTLQKGAIITR